ncbi:AraC family transcriptional regulator [uncultured Tenacibaculum sp.]|uniref:helix-turn-helix domain-containing protein n=1 Tax=uncultured Tenacibaculum sp. TaxID=174713 RepID=UPI0026206145|nr:AraC family transcriptional regulator [uncultured Tenacibaculum sp.]
MDIITLPEDLSIQNENALCIYDYQTSKECLKQMVTLQKNTFSFLIQGNKEVFSNKNNTNINHNSFLLMKKGRCLMTEKITLTEQKNYRSILFFFDNEALINFIHKNNISYVKSPVKKPSIFTFDYDGFLEVFVQSLISISKLNYKVQSKLLETKFEELIVYLINTQGTDFIESLLFEIQNENQHFIEVIEHNKLNKLSLQELSFLANMSLSTFKREFSKHFNTSPSKWFLDQRLEHAALLLQDKSVRPTDIFEEIGYESLSNFVQAFKIKFGITPKQYQLN